MTMMDWYEIAEDSFKAMGKREDWVEQIKNRPDEPQLALALLQIYATMAVASQLRKIHELQKVTFLAQEHK